MQVSGKGVFLAGRLKKKTCRAVKEEAVRVCSRVHKETVAGVEEEEKGKWEEGRALIRARLCGASWTSVRTWAFSLSEMMVPGEHRVTYTD